LTPGTIAAERPAGLPARALSNAILWVAIFLGGFVFFEPAPYDLFLAAVIPVWLILGLTIPRAISPLVFLLTLFVAGGLLAITQSAVIDQEPLYIAVTGFLALSSCFMACIIAEDRRRLDIIVNAWIFSALVTALLGALGYFGLTGDYFVKYWRASGGFQDPNVFGPFLIFPFLVLVRRALTRPLGNALCSAVLSLVILAGIFLSFSRATWALTVVATMMMGALLFVMERNPMARARFIGLAAIGTVLIAILIAMALTLPAVADLFAERAQIVQDYDASHLGRFQRHAIGFNLMLDHPLGIGALEFGMLLGEDEHNIWLKCLTTYGWLGFIAFFTLVLWTVIAAFPLLFRAGPLQAVTQIAYIVFVGHIVMGTVIDIDHWRHVFLLLGLLWGVIAADRAVAQKRLGEWRSAVARQAAQPAQ
jgi:O-antigen ligase